MSAQPERPEPVEYRAATLSGENFAHTADVHIEGDVDINGRLVVGGNLTVDGNLNASDVICFGEIAVTGSIVGSTLFAGFWIKSGATIDVGYIETSFSENDVSLHFVDRDYANDSWFEELVHPDLIEAYLERRENEAIDYAVIAAQDVICFGLFAKGGVEIGGVLDTDIAEVHGYLTAGKIVANEEIMIDGGIECKGDLWGGDIWVGAGMYCGGNCKADSLKADEGDISARGCLYVFDDISTPGNIQAGRWVASSHRIVAGKFIKAGEAIVGEKGISAGRDYGVLAGLAVPRSRWRDIGFVSAPKRPNNMISGEYFAEIEAQTLWDRDKELRQGQRTG